MKIKDNTRYNTPYDTELRRLLPSLNQVQWNAIYRLVISVLPIGFPAPPGVVGSTQLEIYARGFRDGMDISEENINILFDGTGPEFVR